MKTVKDRMVKQMVLIGRCSVGDVVSIPWAPADRPWMSLRDVRLVKIKSLPKNIVQIKYASVWTLRGKPAKVSKLDVPSHVLVERIMKSVDASRQLST